LLGYDLDVLAEAIDPTADMDFDFLGIQTLYDRYLIIDKTKKPLRRLETPQFSWMRVAMGLFIEESSKREEWVVRLYNLYKSRRFCSSTPTLFNSGTLHSQLSSCYLYKVDDSIESIMQRGIAENAYLSKSAWRSWRILDGRARHRELHQRHEWRKSGRDSIPQTPQRPACRRESRRQAAWIGLRLSL
jgi:ribonucleoside-diphosphate reductase alpha chain